MSVIQAATNEQIEAQRREEHERERQSQQFVGRVRPSLAGHIRKVWEVNRDHKRRFAEPLLMQCLRQRNGEYSPDEIADIRRMGGSEIYMGLTQVKCRAAAAWVRDILLPAGDRAWGLESSPIPEPPPAVLQQIQQTVMEQARNALEKAAQQGQQITREQAQQAVASMMEERVDDVKQAAKERADEAAEKHEQVIADQLAEAGYEQELGAFIEDFVVYPAAILKGPVKRRRPTLKWATGWQPVQSYEIAQDVRRVSPWDIYPSPESSEVNDGDLCEHLRYRRSDLYQLIGHPGYDEQALRDVLDQYGRGGLHLWMWGESERARLEGRETMRQNDERIDAIHYWGSVQGVMLLEWGMSPEDVPDPLAEYEIEAILIGDYLIRVQLNRDPLFRRPYHKASFDEVPGAWWGSCPPLLMEDIQRMANATARALANNMGFASGPQIEVYMDRLADGEDPTAIYPFRIWQTRDSQSGAQNRAINWFQPSSNANELLAVFNDFERRADEATNIPRYMYGDQNVGGAGRTASGLSMLMESASKGIRAAISNIDVGVIRPMIEQLYYDNMLHHPDRSIKGDLKPIARGATALVAKDSAQARRVEFAGMVRGDELAMNIIGEEGYADLLREIANGSDIREVSIPDSEEIKRRRQQQQQPSDAELEHQRKMAELKLEAAEKDRRFKLDREKAAAEIKDQRMGNRLDLMKFLAEREDRRLGVLERMQVNAAMRRNDTQGDGGTQRQPGVAAGAGLAGGQPGGDGPRSAPSAPGSGAAPAGRGAGDRGAAGAR